MIKPIKFVQSICSWTFLFFGFLILLIFFKFIDLLFLLVHWIGTFDLCFGVKFSFLARSFLCLIYRFFFTLGRCDRSFWCWTAFIVIYFFGNLVFYFLWSIVLFLVKIGFCFLLLFGFGIFLSLIASFLGLGRWFFGLLLSLSFLISFLCFLRLFFQVHFFLFFFSYMSHFLLFMGGGDGLHRFFSVGNFLQFADEKTVHVVDVWIHSLA